MPVCIMWIRQNERGRKREIAMLCSAAQTNILWRKLLYHENWKTFFSLARSRSPFRLSPAHSHCLKKALPCAQYSVSYFSACHRYFGATFFSSALSTHITPHHSSSSCFICPCCWCYCCFCCCWHCFFAVNLKFLNNTHTHSSCHRHTVTPYRYRYVYE